MRNLKRNVVLSVTAALTLALVTICSNPFFPKAKEKGARGPVVAMTIRQQPKLEYVNGDKLNLFWMVVTLTYQNEYAEDVAYEDFRNYGIETDLANGIALNAEHDGMVVELRYGDIRAYTNPIIMNNSLIRYAAVSGVVPPTKGGLPIRDATAMSNTMNLEVRDVFWSPAPVGAFLGSTRYTALVTLKAPEGYGFDSAMTATINGYEAVVEHNADGTVTVKYAYPATLANGITAISVITQPKLSYDSGEHLDLSSLVVKAIYEDSTSKDLKYDDFITNGIRTIPVHGEDVSFTRHNGRPIEVWYGNLYDTRTGNLTVRQAEIKTVDITEVKSPSKGVVPSVWAQSITGRVTAGRAVWQPEHDFFAGGVVYTVSVDVEADGDYILASGLTATINGVDADVSDNNGRTATVSRAFAVTDTRTISGIGVKQQPHLNYKHGDKLNLTDMVVTLYYDDGTKKDVPFYLFADNNIDTSPAISEKLNRSVYQGQQIQVSAGNFAAYTTSLKIDQRLLSDAIIEVSGEPVFNGEPQGPFLSVTDDPATLMTDADWTTEITVGGLNAGTAIIMVTATDEGNYTGSRPFGYEIKQRSLTGGGIEFVGGPFTYTGDSIAPIMKVFDDLGNELRVGSDYTLPAYRNNTNAGIVTVEVMAQGGGNYTGSLTDVFTINKAPAVISVPQVNAMYGYPLSDVELPENTGTPGTFEWAQPGYKVTDTIGSEIEKEIRFVPGSGTAQNYEAPDVINASVFVRGMTMMRAPRSGVPRAFTMGSTGLTDGTRRNSSPDSYRESGWDMEEAHQVDVKDAFYMGKYQVTHELFSAVMGYDPSVVFTRQAGGIGGGLDADIYAEVYDKGPANRVTWFEAVVFCNELSILEGLIPMYLSTQAVDTTDNYLRIADFNKICSEGSRTDGAHFEYNWQEAQDIFGILSINPDGTGYRLPTEERWEYACRAGTTHPYNGPIDPNDSTTTSGSPYGSESIGWFPPSGDGNGDRRGGSYGGQHPHQVGLKEPNNWGLHDMHGNVWEICEDIIRSDGDISNTVIRGGSTCSLFYMYDMTEPARSAARAYASLFYGQNEFTGFRIMRGGDDPVESITLDITSVTLTQGENYHVQGNNGVNYIGVEATVLPAGAPKNLIWTSTNLTIVYVWPSGNKAFIVGVTPGTATVTAAAADDLSIFATIEVTVLAKDE